MDLPDSQAPPTTNTNPTTMRIQDLIFAASLVALTFSVSASATLACVALLLHFAPTPSQPDDTSDEV